MYIDIQHNQGNKTVRLYQKAILLIKRNSSVIHVFYCFGGGVLVYSAIRHFFKKIRDIIFCFQ